MSETKNIDNQLNETDKFHTEDAILGQRLQECRIAANVTQKVIAEEAGLTTHYISAIERRVHKCNARTLIAYAKKCNVSLDYLVGLPNSSNIIIELKETLSGMDQNQQTRLLEFLKAYKDNSIP